MTAAADRVAGAGRRARVRAAVGLHDPVRPDRDHGRADIDHPGRPVRPRRGRRADPGHLPPGRPEPAADHRRLAARADQRPVRHRGRGRQRSASGTAASCSAPSTSRCSSSSSAGSSGVTMKTGAIQGGIARIVDRLKGRERLMIPILMIVFALGGTTYGMAEESLAFYALIITVMIAAGYDALVGASILLLGCGIGVARLDDQPVRDRHRLGLRRDVSISEGIIGRLVILVVGTAIGIFFVMRYAERVRKDPAASLVCGSEGRQRGAVPASVTDGERGGAHRAPEERPRAVLPRLRRDDLRRHPVGGPGHRPSRRCGGGSRR